MPPLTDYTEEPEELKETYKVKVGECISLESVNYPKHYMCHRNGEIWKDTEDDT